MTEFYISKEAEKSLPTSETLAQQESDKLIEEALSCPIPNMDELRKRKIGYNDLEIDENHLNFNEPVVNIADYGLAGQAYYSRPNAATGEPVPNISANLYLRQSVAERLAQINQALKDPVFTKFFGGEVELYIQDALRPVSLQAKLYNEVFPNLIRKRHFEATGEELDDKEMKRRRKSLIALPSSDPKKPSPHATGGAFDVILRYRQDTKGYTTEGQIPMGHTSGGVSERVQLDYFENNEPKTDEDRLAQRNRRAYYAIMTGLAFGIDTEFSNNPTEWWHWDLGTQLWAKVRNEEKAYYSLAEVER